MGVMLSGDILRVAVVFLFNGTDEQINTFHYRITGTVPSDDDDTLSDIDALTADLYSPIVGHMWSGVTHDRTEVLIENSAYAGFVIPRNSDLDGTQAEEPLAPQNCLLVIGRTAARRKIAKKYLPTMCETDWTNGAFGTSAMTAADGFAGVWQSVTTTVGGLILSPVLYHRATHTFNPISSAQAVSNPAIQRRRRVGRGS